MLLVTDDGLTLRWTIDRSRSVWLQFNDGARCPAVALDDALALPESAVIAALCNVETVERPSGTELAGRLAVEHVIDEETGEILVEAGQRVSDRVSFAAVTAPIELVVTEHEPRVRSIEATREQANRDWLIDPLGAALVGLDPSTANAIRSGNILIGPKCAAALDELVAERERECTTLTSADLVYIWLQFAG